jgi:hypothetical protein
MIFQNKYPMMVQYIYMYITSSILLSLHLWLAMQLGHSTNVWLTPTDPTKISRSSVHHPLFRREIVRLASIPSTADFSLLFTTPTNIGRSAPHASMADWEKMTFDVVRHCYFFSSLSNNKIWNRHHHYYRSSSSQGTNEVSEALWLVALEVDLANEVINETV